MQKKLFLRFSLLTVLFVMTIVALTSACWTLRRQLVLLRQQVAQLEEENLQLRDQAGILTIRDRTKLHAIESPYPNHRNNRSYGRVWSIWVPEGRSFELHIATGWLSSGEFPDESPKGPIILNAGEHRVRTMLRTSPDHKPWFLVLTANNEQRLLNPEWLSWENVSRKSSIVGRVTVITDGTEPLLLWAMDVENLGNQARDGMIVWLKPVSE